ncbi:MAG: ribosomal RNA small subunit methyltransferase A [Verrucomicrobia bacterium 21-51-4]|nr:MAG: ribosomal RNA small subunit methyltransferase A [Verrucomicrobia bacterium 21-51-4]HQU08517.1 16S rRNA (adenine(1518)-N(6)/adenine(1519)-N(6))-dimethyltransferase RsmA [Opitutales bacterium]
MLTPSRTQELLKALDHLPRKSLGQNFLIDANIVRKHLSLADLSPQDVIVEIGPGLGTLTESILAAGHTLYAIELDRTLAHFLEKNLLERYKATFHLSLGDAVDAPLANLPAQIASTQPFKVLANLPYAISTPWLARLLKEPVLPQRMVLMLQKEAAERLTASPGSKAFSAISIFLQSAYRTLTMHGVSRGCFFPSPEVDSVLIVLEQVAKPYRFEPTIRSLIQRIFTQRRKQMGRLCRSETSLGIVEPWLEAMAEAGLPKTSRPEQISIEWWQKLNNLYVEGSEAP